MPKGGILTIETSMVEVDDITAGSHGYIRPGSYVLIVVSDTGVGMNEDVRNKIFDPFFTTKDIGKGTGLGMAIIYGIIQAHQGYINCLSELGEGAMFKVYLPLAQTKITKERSTRVSKELTKGTETILLVEDDPDIREMIETILQRVGYTVIKAVDGEDAVDKYRENKDRVQMVLSDIVMPKMNGVEAYKEMMQENPDVKVLFMSGYPDEVLKAKGIADIGLNLVYKPVERKALLLRVREMIDLPGDGEEERES